MVNITHLYNFDFVFISPGEKKYLRNNEKNTNLDVFIQYCFLVWDNHPNGYI